MIITTKMNSKLTFLQVLTDPKVQDKPFFGITENGTGAGRGAGLMLSNIETYSPTIKIKGTRFPVAQCPVNMGRMKYVRARMVKEEELTHKFPYNRKEELDVGRADCAAYNIVLCVGQNVFYYQTTQKEISGDSLLSLLESDLGDRFCYFTYYGEVIKSEMPVVTLCPYTIIKGHPYHIVDKVPTLIEDEFTPDLDIERSDVLRRCFKIHNNRMIIIQKDFSVEYTSFKRVVAQDMGVGIDSFYITGFNTSKSTAVFCAGSLIDIRFRGPGGSDDGDREMEEYIASMSGPVKVIDAGKEERDDTRIRNKRTNRRAKNEKFEKTIRNTPVTKAGTKEIDAEKAWPKLFAAKSKIVREHYGDREPKLLKISPSNSPFGPVIIGHFSNGFRMPIIEDVAEFGKVVSDADMSDKYFNMLANAAKERVSSNHPSIKNWMLESNARAEYLKSIEEEEEEEESDEELVSQVHIVSPSSDLVAALDTMANDYGVPAAIMDDYVRLLNNESGRKYVSKFDIDTIPTTWKLVYDLEDGKKDVHLLGGINPRSPQLLDAIFNRFFNVYNAHPDFINNAVTAQDTNFSYKDIATAFYELMAGKNKGLQLGEYTGKGYPEFAGARPVNRDDFVSMLHDRVYPGDDKTEKLFAKIWADLGTTELFPNAISLSRMLSGRSGEEKGIEDALQAMAGPGFAEKFELGSAADAGGKIGEFKGIKGYIESVGDEDRVFIPNAYEYKDLEAMGVPSIPYYPGAFAANFRNAANGTSPMFRQRASFDMTFVSGQFSSMFQSATVPSVPNFDTVAPATLITMGTNNDINWNADVGAPLRAHYDLTEMVQADDKWHPCNWTPAYMSLTDMTETKSYGQLSQANKADLYTPFSNLRTFATFLQDCNIATNRLLMNLTLGYIRALRYAYMTTNAGYSSWHRGVLSNGGNKSITSMYIQGSDLSDEVLFYSEAAPLRNMYIVNVNDYVFNRAALAAAGFEFAPNDTFAFWSSTDSGAYASDSLVDFVIKTIMLMSVNYIPVLSSEADVNRPNTNAPLLGVGHEREFFDAAGLFYEPDDKQTLWVLTDAPRGATIFFSGPNNTAWNYPAAHAFEVWDGAVAGIYQYDQFVSTFDSMITLTEMMSTLSVISNKTGTGESFDAARYYTTAHFAFIPGEQPFRYGTDATTNSLVAPSNALANNMFSPFIGGDVLNNSYKTVNGGIMEAPSFSNAYNSIKRQAIPSHSTLYVPTEANREWLLLFGYIQYTEQFRAMPLVDLRTFWIERLWLPYAIYATHWAVTDKLQAPLNSQSRTAQGIQAIPPIDRLYRHATGFRNNSFYYMGKKLISQMFGYDFSKFLSYTFCWSGYARSIIDGGIGSSTYQQTFPIDPIVLNVLAKNVPLLLGIPIGIYDGAVIPYSKDFNDYQRQFFAGVYSMQAPVISSQFNKSPSTEIFDKMRVQLAMGNNGLFGNRTARSASQILGALVSNVINVRIITTPVLPVGQDMPVDTYQYPRLAEAQQCLVYGMYTLSYVVYTHALQNYLQMFTRVNYHQGWLQLTVGANNFATEISSVKDFFDSMFNEDEDSTPVLAVEVAALASAPSAQL